MKKRRLNVQQQNAVLKEEILNAVRKYRSNAPYTRWVSEGLLGAGLRPEQGILVAFSMIPDQAGECAYATWLTSDGRFYKLEALLEYDTHRLIAVETVEDVSSVIEISEHQRGTGRSFGAIALEVLSELG